MSTHKSAGDGGGAWPAACGDVRGPPRDTLRRVGPRAGRAKTAAKPALTPLPLPPPRGRPPNAAAGGGDGPASTQAGTGGWASEHAGWGGGADGRAGGEGNCGGGRATEFWNEVGGGGGDGGGGERVTVVVGSAFPGGARLHPGGWDTRGGEARVKIPTRRLVIPLPPRRLEATRAHPPPGHPSPAGPRCAAMAGALACGGEECCSGSAVGVRQHAHPAGGPLGEAPPRGGYGERGRHASVRGQGDLESHAGEPDFSATVLRSGGGGR